MQFQVHATTEENMFVDVARRAGHVRTTRPGTGDFFVVESEDIVDTATGKRRSPGFTKAPPGPTPRLEFQLFEPEQTIDTIGSCGIAILIVDRAGQMASIGYGVGPEVLENDFREFLLTVGDGYEPAGDRPLEQVDEVLGAVEVFLTLWSSAVDDLLLDKNDRRIADALVSMASEVTKTDDPPREVLRSAFRWFAGRLERFTDEFVGAAGKAAGATAGAAGATAVAALATGRLPQLMEAADRALTLLK